MTDASLCWSTDFEPFNLLRSRFVFLAEDNVDTDQIFPARFMATTSRTGLGEKLFYDRRFDSFGVPISGNLLSRITRFSHRILVAGSNFGSGSSREHAPWALTDFGFRAILAPSFGDIFQSNALQNGLLPIVISSRDYASISRAQDEEMTIDLHESKFFVPSLGIEREFPIDAFARRCLLEGRDSLGWLVSHLPQVAAFEATSGSSRPRLATI